MSQFSQRKNPFRDAETGPRDGALEGAAQPAPAGAERCIAHGCPLPGTVTDSTKGGGPWTCSPHRRAAPDQWPAISERANRAPWILRALTRLAKDGPSGELAAKVSAFCVGEWASLAAERESPAQWAWRFRMGALAWLETGRCGPQAKDEAPR